MRDHTVGVIGGGCVGLSVAKHLAERTDLDIAVIEKEFRLAAHQSGRNSGVLHPGFNYPPGSDKARFATEGTERMKSYCAENNIPCEELGVLVVATTRQEEARLQNLAQQAEANGVEYEILGSQEELREHEPHVTGRAALHAPEAASVDAQQYVYTLARDVQQVDVSLYLGHKVSQLRERGTDVWMITGDNERTARAVAEQVGIDPDQVMAGVLPEDKADAVDDIQSDGRRAMMVGDGVNDAPALATAFVGCAIGSGTDVAIEASDVTLMRSDPLDVLKAIRVSAGTLSKIKQNLFWALGYNTAMIPLASLGLLQPVFAAAAMAVSSVSVLTNSLLFRRYTPDEDYRLFGLFGR